MSHWTAEQLRSIEDTEALYVSPFREDGTTYGTPTETWALVVDSNVYVRAANGVDSRWYQAAIAQGAGRVRVDGRDYEVTFEASGDENEAEIDEAYQNKYATAADAFTSHALLRGNPERQARKSSWICLRLTPRQLCVTIYRSSEGAGALLRKLE